MVINNTAKETICAHEFTKDMTDEMENFLYHYNGNKNRNDRGFYLMFSNGKLTLEEYCDSGGGHEFDILKVNYCPHCGRKIKIKEKSNIVFNEWFLSLPDDYSLYDLLVFKVPTGVRAYNSLYRKGYTTVRDLKILFENYSKKDIVSKCYFSNIGEKTYNDILSIIT